MYSWTKPLCPNFVFKWVLYGHFIGKDTKCNYGSNLYHMFDYVSMQKIAAMKFGFMQQKTTVWLAELPLKVN